MSTPDLEDVLACLRAIEWPCAPPIGVGEFDVLYVSEAEVVVWYTPARDGQRTGEVAIPCAGIAAAWQRLSAGAALDEALLSAVCGGAGVGRWVLALLALVPGASVRQDPLTLHWSPPAPESAAPAPQRTMKTSALISTSAASGVTTETPTTASLRRRSRRRSSSTSRPSV